ncbi:CD2 antigen cytoplasmic tail-binding protein 2 [Parasteatoda tepidariorum]|uniref:CD2 antigen cytoplasmic tail-binding protein 2 n=1 Tax=Parasteatoda tepidariorum TaxID=114398 RepID=UPI000A2C0D7B|nr:CD2 antigen cytoplasmic tail-binding protein 2 [Parasteatoda tepidariorum]XP_042906647.1 CD2 antigen cytoplasmic tail-binding protein 2 [Parasteatoda tepidariorum]
MSSKNQIFNQEELEAEIEQSRQARDNHNFKKSKHSLDSDEEDEKEEAKKYNVLDPNELEGQEDRTIDFDGEIRITPFNMKEELEEGYFDKDGTYIFQKEEDVVKDQWLDDIDWIKVKAREKTKRKVEDDEESDEERPAIDVVDHYTKMLDLMKPKETVQKAICRLGGSTASRSASNKWKKKKDSVEEANTKSEEDVEKLVTLTSLANNLIQSGDMDVYQQTYEKMSYYVNSKTKSNDQNGDDAALDMFGDDFEETVDENKTSVSGHHSPSPTADTNSEVMWEFKWDNAKDSKIYGPFPTSQMQQWVEEEYFQSGVFVRQVDKPDAEFYSSKRMDFELYM